MGCLFIFGTFASNRSQESPDNSLKAIRLIILKTMTRILYLFDMQARIEILQFSCCFKGNNAVIRNHEQDWDGNSAH